MTTLKRILAWWAVYAAVAAVLTLAMMLPPRLAVGDSLGPALANAITSGFVMVVVSLIPAFIVLAAWGLLVERNAEWETGDVAIAISSGIMALLIGFGIGLIGTNPGFAWRTGSYLGDAGQAMLAYVFVTWLNLLLARLIVRGRGGGTRASRELASVAG